MINLHSKFGSTDFLSGMMPNLFAPEYLDEVHVTIPELESQVFIPVEMKPQVAELVQTPASVVLAQVPVPDHPE